MPHEVKKICESGPDPSIQTVNVSLLFPLAPSSFSDMLSNMQDGCRISHFPVVFAETQYWTGVRNYSAFPWFESFIPSGISGKSFDEKSGKDRQLLGA
jgi:hypothetical protein